MKAVGILGLLLALVWSSAMPAVASSPPTYRAAVSYCAAVGTVDYPLQDPRWAGPDYPAWIVRALGVDEAPDTAVWRCFDGVVLGCAAANTIACGKGLWIESAGVVSADIQALCRHEPDTQCLAGTHCLYQCRSGRADFNRYPVDARGFDRRDWRLIRPR